MLKDVTEMSGEEYAAWLLSQPPRPASNWKDGVRKVHHSELGPYAPGAPTAVEWDVFRSQLGRMLADGRSGQFVLIDGESVVGYFPTFAEAFAAAGTTRHGDRAFIHEVEEYIPVLRSGYAMLCR